MARIHPLHAVVAGVALMTLWLLQPTPVVAWNADGHRLIANIAYDRLDPATRARIVQVLRQHEDFAKGFKDRMPPQIQQGPSADRDRWLFLQAAIWPDLIRPVRKYHKDTWHYINKPYFLSELDRQALQDTVKPNLQVTLPSPLTPAARDRLNCIQAFKLCVHELSGAEQRAAQRAICMCWLLHIGGDIHQPLHSTSLVSRGRFHESWGDKGGNGIKIEQGSNLHSFWDGLLGDNQNMNEIRGRAAAILEDAQLKAAAQQAVQQLAIEDWADESHKLAKEFAYHKLILAEVAARESEAKQPLRQVDLPAEYLQKAGRIAQQRVAAAGYRLAEILKQIEK